MQAEHILNEGLAARIEVVPEPTPETLTLADYQRTAMLQVQADPGGETVGGVPLLQYMLDGAYTEFQESITNPKGNISRSVPLVFDLTGAPTRSRRYRALQLNEEVGDMAWYVCNSLTLLGIRAKETLDGDTPLTISERFDKQMAADFPEGCVQRRNPGEFYCLAAGDYFQAVAALFAPVAQPADEAAVRIMQRERIAYAADTLLVSAALLLQTQGFSLARSLFDNRTKIRRRIQNGAVFDHSDEY